MNEFLVMWLEGPLQSWGHNSRFDIRDTLPFPTWSGLCGIICCAMGKGGEQTELLKKLTRYPPQLFAFEHHNYGQTVLQDYHGVGGGLNADDPFEVLMIPKTREGKKPTGVAGNIRTWRYALQDSVFCALQRFDGELSSEIATALERPYWQIYLGRKAYTPSSHVLLGTYPDEGTALSAIKETAKSKDLTLRFKVTDGQDDEADDCILLNDVPLKFGIHKEYASRYVSIFKQH